MNDLSASHTLVSLDTRSFGKTVQQGVVLVDFSEPWCAPCHLQLPILERVAAHYSQRATVALLNVDDARELALRFKIEAIPTLMLFKNGKVIRTLVGVHSERELTSAIANALDNP